MPRQSSVSRGSSYQKIGAFWDDQDATETGCDDVVEFDLRLDAQPHYFVVDQTLYARMSERASERGVSEESLLNALLKDWLDQRDQEQGRGSRRPTHSDSD